MEMKDLEAIHGRYGERRRTAGAPMFERRKMPTGWLLQARAAYVMRVHRLNCDMCRAGGSFAPGLVFRERGEIR
jgi:hypothetical protein